MVNIVIYRSSGGVSIDGFTIEGHAGYAESGKDIVCAGVSAVSVGAVNALDTLLDVRVKHTMVKGELKVQLPDNMDGALAEQAQLIVQTMVVMLETIRESYSRYVAIEYRNEGGVFHA